MVALVLMVYGVEEWKEEKKMLSMKTTYQVVGLQGMVVKDMVFGLTLYSEAHPVRFVNLAFSSFEVSSD